MNRNIHYIYIIALLLLMGVATTVHAQTIQGNVYGGGNLSQVEGSTTINIKSGGITAEEGSEDGNIYGGGYGATAVLTGNTTINVTGGTIAKDAYGGGALANVTGSTEVNIKGGTVTQDVYGGGAFANVSANTSVNLTGGTIRDSYGGGLGSAEVEALIGGNATTTLNGSVVNGSVFGCNNLNGTPQGHAKVHVLGTTPRDGQGDDEYDVAAVYGGGNLAAYEPTNADDFAEVLIENCDNSIEYVYGGGNAAPVPATQVTIKGANAIDNAFAGGNGAGADNPGADIGYKGFFSSGAATEYGTGIATINVQGGTIHHVYGGSNTLGYIKDHAVVNVNAEGDCTMDVAELYGGGKMAPGKAAQINITCTGNGKIDNVYGGAHMANLTGDITLNINGGNIGNAFGGNNESGTIDGTITVNVNWNTETCGTNSLNNVYGAGNKAAYTGSPAVNILNGTVSENVFGGGLEATVTGNPTVTVSGGTVVHDVYGGGALADVDGSTTVNLTGGAVGGAYGGALGQLEDKATGKEAIAAKVNGNTTVMLNGTQITETGVFGCNNFNGTPRGHAFVHVLKTAPRDGAAYDVPAVYGGGNLSAYEPTAPTEYAEVLIENCDNSIEYVYGGGNAAPVPATQVTIHGANAINHAFAGGNGAGAGNPGADVGYLGYFSKGNPTEYGTGTSKITVTGGTVHNVYGGSNTLGYIRGGTEVSVKEGSGECLLNVGNVFGGGNEADIDCSVTMNLDCNEGGAILYAGANNADVNGNITLNIYSGTYGKVFCGNNVGGKILGSLKVNVDETGCWPVMIGELYACGNLAPYTVYGYDSDGKIRTEGEPVYSDPEINLISFTRIGKVFGGGYGETAVLYGNTKVNVHPIKGIFAGRDDVKPAFVLDGNDERKPLTEVATLPYGIGKNGDCIAIPDEAGSIGTIYGGGNAGAVYGNTEVNIGTKTKWTITDGDVVKVANKHIGGNDIVTSQEVAVTITGNVFGGGNEAIVSGDTKVTIGD